MTDNKNRIYVGNLEYSVTGDELSAAFKEKGVNAQSAEVIKDKYTGRSKGFGFVQVETEDDVDKAIEAMNGQDLKGRTLRVNKAQKPRDRFDRGERRSGGGGGGFNRRFGA